MDFCQLYERLNQSKYPMGIKGLKSSSTFATLDTNAPKND